ncbi:PA14 domain-containing protein [Psychroflexus tropicus]|uniref:PA14 domain-containing protein n=1 Tax=Psychroflexus tropicus TaxID=197345 RepID=UPI00035F78FD|nr:PA14 domain-containing protein [Psychroflexus tropicus]
MNKITSLFILILSYVSSFAQTATLIQSTEGVNSSGSQVSVSFTATPTEGNLLVAIPVTEDGNAGNQSNMLSSGWTKVTDDYFNTAGTNRRGFGYYYKIAGASEATLVSAEWTSGGDAALALQEFSVSGNIIGALDQFSVNNSGATQVNTINSGNTPGLSSPNSLVLGLFLAKNDTPIGQAVTFTNFSNTVNQNTNPDGDAISLETGFKTVNSTTAQNANINYATTAFLNAGVFAFSLVTDTDEDGVPDSVDLDSDNDGLTNFLEQGGGSLNYEFYNSAPAGNTVDNIPTSGAIATGTVSDFDVDALWQAITPGDNNTFSIRYTGTINITSSGTYTFYTSSDDGSKLFIEGTEVVNNDGLHSNRERQGNITLTAGDYDIEVLFFENSGGENLSVSYAGPSISKQPLPFLIVSAGGTSFDTDGDGTPDYLDLDSDNDGCSDANEYYGLSDADGGDDGVFGAGAPAVDADGLVIAAGYDGIYFEDVTDNSINRACDDFDADSVPNFVDLDDDNDGVLDSNESDLNFGELNYEYYDLVPSGFTVDNIPNTGATQTGVASDFDVEALSIAITGNAATYSVRFTGFVDISTDDTYTFFTNSDDGSKLFIDGVEVVDNDGLHSATEVSGSIALTEGLHFIEILYFENTGDDLLEVSYESSTITKTQIPFSVLASPSGDLDTDGDGLVNRFDLDSDDDGCSDANEYYALANADGGDDGVFGAGVPVVDAQGRVISAGYNGFNYTDAIDDSINEGCSFIFETTGNWNETSNWNTNTIPNSSNDVIVRANATVPFQYDTRALTLDSGFEISINSGASLNANGNIINNGLINGDGEVILDGTSAQMISGDGSFENLRLDNPTSVSIDNPLDTPMDLNGVLYVDQGTFNTDNNLYLRCSFTPVKTAQVAPVNGAIVGNVTVEQCFPARRAFRFISSSVTGGTIQSNWQEGVNNTGLNFPTDNQNPNPGFGTHITGSITGANGFDATGSGNPSMFTFSNNVPRQWDAIASTNQALEAGTPYRLFIRGDRGINVTSNSAIPTNTRLRATGALLIGNTTQSVLSNVGGEVSFVANPYQAQVDMNTVLSASTNISTAEYYVWDPTLGGAPTVGQQGGRGAYVTVDLPAGTNSITSSANQYLQPMQAAFVLTSVNGPASVTFEESMKAVEQTQTEVKSLSKAEYINIQLFDAESYAEGNTPSDGLRIKFDKSYNKTTEDDSPKLSNLDENLARVEDNVYSAIERRPFPEVEEELALFINQYRREAYVMKFDLTDNLNTQVFLKDAYLNELTEMTSSENTYAFSIDNSIPESVATDRFSLVFEPESLSTVEESLSTMSLYPNPTQGSFSITGRDLEQGAELEIYNMLGQQVYKQSLSGQSTIEVTDFKANTGIYLVKLKTNQGERTFKLIKQ